MPSWPRSKIVPRSTIRPLPDRLDIRPAQALRGLCLSCLSSVVERLVVAQCAQVRFLEAGPIHLKTRRFSLQPSPPHRSPCPPAGPLSLVRPALLAARHARRAGRAPRHARAPPAPKVGRRQQPEEPGRRLFGLQQGARPRGRPPCASSRGSGVAGAREAGSDRSAPGTAVHRKPGPARAAEAEGEGSARQPARVPAAGLPLGAARAAEAAPDGRSGIMDLLAQKPAVWQDLADMEKTR